MTKRSGDGRRWVGTIKEILVGVVPPDVAFANAIESIKAIHQAGPTHTLADLIDSPYARGLPKGKTLHVVEHRVDRGLGAFTPCCTELFVTRLKGAPSQVVSRIHRPAIDRLNADDFWRRSGDALVDDGFDLPVIRRRVDRLVDQLASGTHLSHAPLRPGSHSRQGSRDIEAKQRFDLTLHWLSVAREFTFREESVQLVRAVRIRVLNQSRAPLAGLPVRIVNHLTKRKLQCTTDSDGTATFADLPPGEYGVRVYGPDGALLGSGSARPETHRFMNLHYDPIPESTPLSRYQQLHRAARAQRRPPTPEEAADWLTHFFPEFLERADRRPAVISVLRRRVSTGKGRYKAGFQSPRRLAEALTAALFGRTPRAVRMAVDTLERRWSHR